MAYTENDIQRMAKEIASAGAPQDEVERFISLARQENQQAEMQTKDLPVGAEQVKANALALADGAEPSAGEGLMQGLKATGSMVRAAGLPAAGGATGAAIGAMGGPMFAPVTIPAGSAIGSAIGDIIAQRQEGGDYSLGRTLGQAALGAFTPVKAATTALRFLPQLESSMVPLHAQAAKYAMQGMGAKTLETMVDRGEAPSAGELAVAAAGGAAGAKLERMAQAAPNAKAVERMVNDAVTNQNVKDWLAKGGKIDPTLTYRESFLNRGLSKVAGGSNEVQRAANEVNQQVANKLAREDIRLAGNVPLDDLHLADHIIKLSAPLREIEGISPSFKGMVESHRAAREEARAAWTAYKSAAERGAPDSELRKAAQQLTATADKAADDIANALKAEKRTDLLDEYNVSRRLLAKTYQVRDANLEGNVSAEILSMMRDAQKRNMDGNLELIARFRDTMPKVMRNVQDIQPVGDVGFSPLASGAGRAATGYFGSQAMGASPMTAAAVAGAAGIASPAAARGMMMNPFYQRVMAAPRYGVEDPSFQQNLMRMLAMSGGQQ